MVSVGEAIPALLAAYGVDIAFGIPGTHSIPLYRGLAQGTLRHVLPRHEQGAAFMADGYAQISGRPALCCVITGPGLTNAATGIAQAFSSSTPMLVITPVNERETLGKGWGRLHEITDQSAVARPITAFSGTVHAPSDVPQMIADAFAVFSSARPRPVHIEIPLDVMTAPAGDGWELVAPPSPPAADPAAIEEAAKLLIAAERPLIVAGGGARQASATVVAVAEALCAPVATTHAGKGIIPSRHDLSLGSSLSLPGTQSLLRAADVVLAVGTELSEVDAWVPWLDIPGKIIRIDIDPHELTSDYPSAVAVHADARTALEALRGEIGQQAPPSRDMRPAIADALAGNLASITPLQRRHLDTLDVLRSAWPEEAIVVTDMTQIAYTADRFLSMEHPGRYLGPHGYGTLGYALPAAIGAKLAAPDAPVVALAGDSGILYTVQEMATAAELGLPIVLTLWNNGALGQIRDDMIEAQFPPFAVAPQTPDFQALARAFGWEATLVDSPASLRAATEAALSAAGPTLIEVRDETDI